MMDRAGSESGALGVAIPDSPLFHSLTHGPVTVPSWLTGRRQQVVEVITDFGLIVREDDQTPDPSLFGTGPVPETVLRLPDSEIVTLGPFPMPLGRHETEEET